MPRGPKGEKRPAGVIETAHVVFQIAIGEKDDETPNGRRRGGIAGAKARKEALTDERRREIAKKAASVRWGHHGKN